MTVSESQIVLLTFGTHKPVKDDQSERDIMGYSPIQINTRRALSRKEHPGGKYTDHSSESPPLVTMTVSESQIALLTFGTHKPVKDDQSERDIMGYSSVLLSRKEHPGGKYTDHSSESPPLVTMTVSESQIALLTFGTHKPVKDDQSERDIMGYSPVRKQRMVNLWIKINNIS
ncbi:hypothetical protein BDA99DRAFT_557293 [Phascolomyces articulosus]|uniref:Uncharacterized protein n=1 Tax=Phascolomyces articulosus TaxID=60185 RepID=A0AAD5PI85_9FUNG|nr:hypothetical protein BDA99DRAFT_557293 [Phascolomyces articulosus]